MISNPVLRKELLVRLRFGRMPHIQRVGILIAIALMMGYVYFQVFNALRSDPLPSTGHGAWVLILCLQFTFVCLLAPVIAANAITQEREQMTWEMLIFTLLRPSEIIFGKLLARMLTIVVILALGFPVACFAWGFASFAGHGSSEYISPGQFVGAYVTEFIVGLFFATFGLFMSWLFKRTLYAIMAAYTFVVAVLIIGTVLVTSILSQLVGDWNFLTSCPLMWFNPIMMIMEVVVPSHPFDSLQLFYGLVGYCALTALMLWRMVAGFRRFAFES